jgi:tRNA U55 pseudouridine synthase TruB
MGNILGCGAYLHSLRRESVGDFSLPGFCPSEHNTQYHTKEVWREILEKYRAPHLRNQ